MNIQAPLFLKTWLESNQVMMQQEGIKFELRLPSEKDNLNKAALALDADSLLASLTIWGNGMIEYIVMNCESDEDIYSTDIECKNEQQLCEKLNVFLHNFKDLIIEHRAI